MNSLWIAIGVLGVLGLLFGLILGYSARRFKVEEDPIVEKIDAILSVWSSWLSPLCRSGS